MRKVAIFTGNRAEYGLQYPIIKAVDTHPDLEYYLLVSGAHLNEDFGRTVAEIERDGFRVHREVRIEMVHDTLYATARAIGTGILSLSEVLLELKPDILVVYADRFEGFSAVITGTQMGIATAHIEGGDITEGGALDDSVRHAMTKLAHLHFTTNEDAASRICAMGEEPWRVFNVGFPAIDLIAAGNLASRDELVAKYALDPGRPIVLFTQHSVTTEFDQAEAQITPGLDALSLCARKGFQVLVTYPNNDAGGKRIVDRIRQWYGEGIPNVQVHASLGRYNYHGILHLCGNGGGRGVCVGNSSSGIKETPALGCTAVNIGSRQQGRLRANNVLDTAYDRDEIVAAIEKALFDEEFRARCRTCFNPYGKGDAGENIAATLATVSLGPRLIQKRMTLHP
jgi:UDP-N-acetylglucosamine 2-epimerase (non-hydrolysing)/GDP/UDP-N,N'-diacetylbacillosamine 2-epimerase (hydrolysing)